MLVDIRAITLSDEVGAPVCTKAKVMVAVSDSIAVQIIPVDSNGVEHPNESKGIVGNQSTVDLQNFYNEVEQAVINLISAKGF